MSSGLPDPSEGIRIFDLLRGFQSAPQALDHATRAQFAAQAEEMLREGSVFRHVFDTRYRTYLRESQSGDSVEVREQARMGLQALLGVENMLRDVVDAFHRAQ